MPSTLFKNAALLDPLQPELLTGHDVLVEDTMINAPLESRNME